MLHRQRENCAFMMKGMVKRAFSCLLVQAKYVVKSPPKRWGK